MNHNIEQQLREQGYYVSTTVGTSMWPMLRNRRDRVIVLPVGEEKLKKYDLPLYRRPDGKYILHRILDVKDGEYIIRGDNTYFKEHVPHEWVIGYVSEFYRADKHILSTSRGYQVYIRIWRLIYPIRYVFFKLRSLAAAIYRRIFRRKKKDSSQ